MAVAVGEIDGATLGAVVGATLGAVVGEAMVGEKIFPFDTQ